MGQREWKAQVEAWRVGQSYWVNSWRDLIQIFGTRNERTFRCSTSILVLRRKEGVSYLQHSYILTRGNKNSPISPKNINIYYTIIYYILYIHIFTIILYIHKYTIYTHYCIITFGLLCSLSTCKYFVFAYSYATPFAHRARRNATNAVGHEEGERERERSFYCFTGGIKFRTVI